jgi:hypothetical protein
MPRDGLSGLHRPWGGSVGPTTSLGRACCVYTIHREGLSGLHHPWGGSLGSTPSLGRVYRVYTIPGKGLLRLHHPQGGYVESTPSIGRVCRVYTMPEALNMIHQCSSESISYRTVVIKVWLWTPRGPRD